MSLNFFHRRNKDKSNAKEISKRLGIISITATVQLILQISIISLMAYIVVVM
ncbi:hypothetical protein ACNF42_01080 [Cuniculiplasma sp. SKW3]|uniref:hypothetical protein n=1 Tax=Cuniculiplasma sp. SKW3 TaxID=3400170 RepID=UPI003FD44F67